MSETLLRFLLSELTTVRVACKGKLPDGSPCGLVFEMPVNRLANQPTTCPSCKALFLTQDKRGNAVNPFVPLAEAIDTAVRAQKIVEIEFTLPEVGKPKP